MRDTAIVTYLDNTAEIITEFAWLYKSWLYSGSWKTARLVVFHNPSIDMSSLPNDSYIDYIPVKPLTEISDEWKAYPFINSVYYLTTEEARELNRYNYVLRTDHDVFLTSNFPNLRPRIPTFGIGAYAYDPMVTLNLVKIAVKWGMPYIFNNIGSTFMASANQVLSFSHVQLNLCKKLKDEEFPNGHGEWPKWYFGVLTMYAGQLAAGAVFGDKMTMGGIDVQCFSNNDISSTDFHIHAWHTYEYFSKFKWREGEYKNKDMRFLNRDRISDYCLWIAGNGT